jgi:hypothetical protein
MEPRTWALRRLEIEAEAAADVLPQAMRYAAGFLLHKRGVPLADAGERDLWHAVFVVRRRAQQLRRAAARRPRMKGE